MTNEEMILQELEHAGEEVGQTEMRSHLNKLRITPDKEIPPMQFLFQLFGKPCFPRGELVALSGKPKSGKTFVSSILMSLCFREEVLTLHRLTPDPLRVMWYDTEQSEESTQDILRNRILPMISPLQQSVQVTMEDWFNIFNVRRCLWQERLPLLETGMRMCSPDLVILDGIRDLVNDINDGVLAQEVIEKLMRLASELNCCLVCVLHQNKASEDKNLRGFIGTELTNKAFEVYDTTKDENGWFTLKQINTRKFDIRGKLVYSIGQDGLPRLSNGPVTDASDGKSVVTMDVERMFADAFRPGESKTATCLQETVMHMYNISSFKFYNDKRKEALQKGILVERRDSKGHVFLSCPLKPAARQEGPVQTEFPFQ